MGAFDVYDPVKEATPAPIPQVFETVKDRYVTVGDFKTCCELANVEMRDAAASAPTLLGQVAWLRERMEARGHGTVPRHVVIMGLLAWHEIPDGYKPNVSTVRDDSELRFNGGGQ